MKEKQTTIKKSIDTVFLLDESKLTRLVNIIIENYSSIGVSPTLTFEMHLFNGKHIAVNDLEHVFTQDNSVKNPIEILNILFDSSTVGKYYRCNIILNKSKNKIDIYTSSDDMKWANDLFSEIDEQIERILVKDYIYSIKDLFSFLITLLIITSLFVSFVTIASRKSQPDEKNFFLSNEEVNQFIKNPS